jgi:hypothetical protein
MLRGHSVVAASGGSAKHYDRHVSAVYARRSGFGEFDGTCVPHQPINFIV